jgi:hypothetical protein
MACAKALSSSLPVRAFAPRKKLLSFDRHCSMGLKSREWKRQETELRVRCAAMNKMTSLGMPHGQAV